MFLVPGCLPRCERAVEATKKPRVVSLHDVTTEMVVKLGAVDTLVGVEEPVDIAHEVKAAISSVQRVSSLETILATRPTVVLGLRVIAQHDPELIARLRSRGIDVYLGDPKNLSQLGEVLNSVAERVERREEGQKLLAELQTKMTELTVQTSQPLRVFVFDCCNPPFTTGGKTMLSDLIRRAGGQNIFADLDVEWTNVAWEEVVARKPQLIVIHSYEYEGQGDVPDKIKTVQAFKALANVPTVVIPLRDSLGGLESVKGLEILRAAIRGH